jgi:hypothetical protein
VPGGNDPREPDFEQANSQLNEGLKTCRSVVDNYRAMLAEDPGEGTGVEPGLPIGEGDSEGGESAPDQPDD